MTDKELKKLSRMELLEMLLVQTREVERLQAELERLNSELEHTQEQTKYRELELSQAGSIAEAALQVNGVFEAAQKAADEYLNNLHRLEAGTLERCKKIEALCRKLCQRYVQQAEQEAKRFWLQIQAEIQKSYPENERRLKIQAELEGKLNQKLTFNMGKDEKTKGTSDAGLRSAGAGDKKRTV